MFEGRDSANPEEHTGQGPDPESPACCALGLGGQCPVGSGGPAAG